MEKYFQTLTFTRPQTVKAWKRALRVQHGVGPEADYIIRLWKGSLREEASRVVVASEGEVR